LELPRAAEIVSVIFPEAEGATSLSCEVDAAGEGSVGGVADEVSAGAGLVTTVGVAVVFEFEMIICPPANATNPITDAMAKDFQEIFFRSLKILVTLFSTNMS
jgi:hypothetical protein